MDATHYHNPNDNWKPRPDEGDILKMLVKMLIACVMMGFMMWLLSGCRSVKYVPVIEHSTDTIIQKVVAHDSIHVHDSIWVTQTGDTVRIEKWHTKFIERIRHDTLYQHRVDSIPQPYPVEVEVEKPLSWWQKVRLTLADILLAGLLVFIIYRLGK